MHNTKVRDLMEQELVMISPNDTLHDASRKMRDAGCGCLPVGDGDETQGVVTDRDIVIRAVAGGLDPAIECVRDHMTADVRTCHTDDTLFRAAEKMRDNGVSRLLVVDDLGKTRGILSFGRIMRNFVDADEIGEVMTRASGRDGTPVITH